MVLTVDIGNSSITLGIFDDRGKLVISSKMSAVKTKCEDEYSVLLKGIFDMYNIRLSEIDGIIICSVVPPLSNIIFNSTERLFNIKALIVEPGIKTGLNIKIDNHTQLGTDIVVNTVAAMSKYERPLIIVDMGTATTITIVNDKGELCGEVILPGVRLSLEALSSGAALLPYISLETPKNLIGKNTIDSMNSGIIYGNAFMIDGFANKICDEFNISHINIIATGGLAEKILPYCNHDIIFSPHLSLEGLYILYQMNHKKHKLV